MDFFDYLRTSKMNDFEEAYPTTTKVSDFIGTGPKGSSPFYGLLGMKKKVDDTIAAKYSNTTVGTLKNGVYQLVRAKAGITVADWVVGRPLFWSDKSKFEVTTVAATTAEFAGVAISTLTTSGTFKIIQVAGDAPGLLAAALTKAAPAINDPVVLLVAANLATFDVELDATGWSNAIVKRWAGYLGEAAVAGAVKKVHLSLAHVVQNRGIM